MLGVRPPLVLPPRVLAKKASVKTGEPRAHGRPRERVSSPKGPKTYVDSEAATLSTVQEMGVAMGQAVVQAIAPMLNSGEQQQAEMFPRMMPTQREESLHLRQLMTTLESGTSTGPTEQCHLPDCDPPGAGPMATELP